MRLKSAYLALFVVAVGMPLLGATGPASLRCSRVDPAALFFPIGGGEWSPIDGSSASVPRDFVPDRVLPLLFFNDHGKLTLTSVGVGEGFLKEGEFELEGACNGGQCDAAGTALNCPTSGGPTCGPGKTCHCVCESGGGQTTTHNECR